MKPETERLLPLRFGSSRAGTVGYGKPTYIPLATWLVAGERSFAVRYGVKNPDVESMTVHICWPPGAEIRAKGADFCQGQRPGALPRHPYSKRQRCAYAWGILAFSRETE